MSTPHKGRMTVVMVGVLGLAGAVVGRAAYIQLFSNPRLEQMARRQFQSKVLVRPRRGPIQDRNGEPLAINVETQSLAANPSKVLDRHMMARILSKASDIPYPKLLQRLSEKKEFVWLKRHLSESELNRLKKWRVIDADGDLLAGLWMVKESQRVYPHGELAGHILGEVNVDSEGVEGIELLRNERLRGKIASVSAIKDALGRPAFIDTVAAKSVQDGDAVGLTIDASLQYSVEQELKNAVHKTGAHGGSVIVMNAVNGEILAMANEPSFNPNDHGAPTDRRRNRAITDGYEPGSTLKAVLASSALTHGWKLTDQVWGERGKFKVQGHSISEAEAKEKFEWLSLKKIIKVSSNVGAAKVALKLGADNYLATLHNFGFGSKTDVGFPGEISGRIPPRKSWQPLTLANIGFGQGILVTPIQMTRAYATFLNGGWLVQPTLIKSDEKSDGAGDKHEAPRRILSQKVSEQVLEALKSVTEKEGTGLKAVLEGYTVAGKTGTAQEVESGTGKYSRTKHIASFIGYAVGVEPKLVIFTSINEPHGVYFAAETAAPLFKEVLGAVANRFSMPSIAPEVQPKLAVKSGLKLAPKSVLADRISVAQAAPEPMQWEGAGPRGGMIWKMPPLKGLTPREAVRALAGHPFSVEIKGTGIVRTQTPDEGKPVADGETVRLNLGEP